MKKLVLAVFAVCVLFSCKNDKEDNGKLQVVTTTTMITDLVSNIGGDLIDLQGLMGSGVDPHLYKASEGDVSKLTNADIIFYNGLHLEGKLVEVFEKMANQNKVQVALAEKLDAEGLIGSDYFASNYDPHVWFNIDYWMIIGEQVYVTLIENDPDNAKSYEENWHRHLNELVKLQDEIQTIVNKLPTEQRILVTAHDAFNYFGQEYEFDVVGLQGLSTATEAGVQDVQNLATFIQQKQLKAIFVESSVPKRTIEALQAAVRAKGHEVIIGGTLFSDALGTKNTPEGTYLGMYRHNVNTIVNALK